MYSKRSPPTVSAGMELPYISIPSSCGIAPSTGISRRRRYSSMLGSVREATIQESVLPSSFHQTEPHDHTRCIIRKLDGQLRNAAASPNRLLLALFAQFVSL